MVGGSPLLASSVRGSRALLVEEETEVRPLLRHEDSVELLIFPTNVFLTKRDGSQYFRSFNRGTLILEFTDCEKGEVVSLILSCKNVVALKLSIPKVLILYGFTVRQLNVQNLDIKF